MEKILSLDNIFWFSTQFVAVFFFFVLNASAFVHSLIIRRSFSLSRLFIYLFLNMFVNITNFFLLNYFRDSKQI